MNNVSTITLEWVRERKAKLQAEIADLEATERVLLAAVQPSEVTWTATNSPLGYGSKKRTLLRVIANKPTGLTTKGVIEAATELGLKNLKTENVSPQLSMYKGDDLLDQVSGLWMITQKGRDFLAAQNS